MEELLIIGGVGVAGIIVFGSAIALVNPQAGEAISETGRTLAKNGLKLGMEAVEKVQSSIAEAGESWNDIVAEAKAERESVATNSRVSPSEDHS
ncbi:DUF5132 domain-containing protein [Pannus brasiliensis CCIBt3594]|uniref:DUF5132 domain-containing protein n=1 Tax=Pannus brasiliensis CCIBt3594 TaxID=1427578 RepID=A0AAW9QL55_9CHRO